MLFQNSAEAPNGEPYAEHTVYQESPQKETIFIAVPDEDHVDLGSLGDYLRQQAELFDGTAVDSRTDRGDNGPTESDAKEDKSEHAYVGSEGRPHYPSHHR